MSNTIRKIARASAAMLVIVMTIVSLFSIPTSAATAWPSMSSSKYCEFIAPKNINVYRNTSFTAKNRGTCSPAKSYNALIEKNDKCKIYAATSSYLKVAYPTSSGQRIGYIKRSDLFDVSSPSERATSQNKVNTASVKGGARSYGYIAKGDNVWNVGTSGSWTAVIYDAKSGSRAYKLGFIPSTDYSSKVKKPATAPKTTTPKTTTPNGSSSATKLLNMAKTQIGYQGTKANGTGSGDNTKYGKFTNANNAAWCASYVAWCAHQVGISTNTIPRSASCTTMANGSDSYVKWDEKAIKNIGPGDVVFFASGGVDCTKQHVGIVSVVSGKKVTVIEGNTSSDVVKPITYTVENSGFINQRWKYDGKYYNMYFSGYINL